VARLTKRYAALLAWAELEGPLSALLLGRFSSSRQDEWEVVA